MFVIITKDSESFNFAYNAFNCCKISQVISDDFFLHEAERDVKINMHNNLFADYQKRHFISIRLVRAVHNENFVIAFQKNFRDVLDEKKMNDASFLIFLNRIRSIFLFQLSNQRLT
jgi:hypothetical protein